MALHLLRQRETSLPLVLAAFTGTQFDAKFRIEAAVGRYDLGDAYDNSHSHAQLGAVRGFKAPFELRVIAHGTDSAAKRLFPDLAGSRVEAALRASS